jgi:hypothetical protein
MFQLFFIGIFKEGGTVAIVVLVLTNVAPCEVSSLVRL